MENKENDKEVTIRVSPEELELIKNARKQKEEEIKPIRAIVDPKKAADYFYEKYNFSFLMWQENYDGFCIDMDDDVVLKNVKSGKLVYVEQVVVNKDDVLKCYKELNDKLLNDPKFIAFVNTRISPINEKMLRIVFDQFGKIRDFDSFEPDYRNQFNLLNFYNPFVRQEMFMKKEPLDHLPTEEHSVLGRTVISKVTMNNFMMLKGVYAKQCYDNRKFDNMVTDFVDSVKKNNGDFPKTHGWEEK